MSRCPLAVADNEARNRIRERRTAYFALIDGWPVAGGPSLARQVIEILAPQLRTGAFVVNDNAEPDFLDFVRDPTNGFISVTLPLKGGTELAVMVG